MSVTTISYSYDYYLRNIYSSNRFARKSENRTSLKPTELVQADSDAIQKISDKLRDLEYSSDTADDIYTNVKAFIETYNNLISSTNSGSNQISRIKSQITSLTKEQKDDLESMGISIGANGKLTMDKTEFGKCSASKIERFFGKDSEYTAKLKTYAQKAKRIARREPVITTDETDTKKSSKTTIIPAPEQTSSDPATSINVIV